jgi:hypothetical protein
MSPILMHFSAISAAAKYQLALLLPDAVAFRNPITVAKSPSHQLTASYFLAQNAFPGWRPPARIEGTSGKDKRLPPDFSGGSSIWLGWIDRGTLPCGLLLLVDGFADVDEVVGDYAESGPAFHSANALIPASVESVPPLEDADASFASGPPLLTFLKPTLLLLTLECGAFGGAAWNGCSP